MTSSSSACSTALRNALLTATMLVMSCAVANGQFAPTNAPPTFSSAPSSTMGTVTNNLVLAPLTNGFTVSGQVIVSVPPGPVSGTLVQWTVVRPIDPAFSSSGMVTNTTLNGFSAPPAGTFAASSGILASDWRFSVGGPLVGGSQSSIPLTLVNGVDSPPWSNLTAVSGGPPGFTWTAGFFPNAVMQQQFTLFGSQTGGAGGNWVINVSATSITIVPCNGFDSCDVNCDGSINPFDIQAILALLGPNPPPPCSTCAGDANDDGSLNPFDIQAFLGCL